MSLGFEVLKVDGNFDGGPAERRDCFEKVFDYLMDEGPVRQFCALFGLMGTGKTTIMRQCAAALPAELKEKALFLRCGTGADVYKIMELVEKSIREGYRYFFVDEITSAESFQRVGELLTNVYVNHYGARIVATGDDSMGFSLPSHSNMYDRIRFIPTTYVPFAERVGLVGDCSVDEWMQTGGTLVPGALSTQEKAMGYTCDAIVGNVMRSLKRYKGMHWRSDALMAKHEATLLEDALLYLLNTCSVDVVYSSLQRGCGEILGMSEPSHVGTDEMPTLEVTPMLMERQAFGNLLGEQFGRGFANPEAQFSAKHDFEELQKYLVEIDALVEVPLLHTSDDWERTEYRRIVPHPGTYYGNLAFLFEGLKNDDRWLLDATQEQREKVLTKASDWARGIIMENIVVADTYHLLCDGKPVKKEDSFGIDTGEWYVSKLRCQVGSDKKRDVEVDMVIHNKLTKDTYLFEVKHSAENVPGQSKHLENPQLLEHVEKYFGPVKGRAVLYNGPTVPGDGGSGGGGVPRISAKEFLLQMYEDVRGKDFSPEKTLEVLSPGNIGAKEDNCPQGVVQELLDDAENRLGGPSAQKQGPELDL